MSDKLSRNQKPYNRMTCCWNCQLPGHTANQCTSKKRLFCSYCLKNGITTRNCNCRFTPRRINPPIPHNDMAKYPECSLTPPLMPNPLWISVANESFRSFIDTSRVQTSIGYVVATKASILYQTRREFIRNESGIVSEMLTPIRIMDTIRVVRCRIVQEPVDVIILGWDALRCFGCNISIGPSPVLKQSGCSPVSHQSVFDIAITREIENTPIPARTPLCPKNPINLNLFETIETNSLSIEDIDKMRFGETNSNQTTTWSEQELLKSPEGGEELVVDLNDEELERYLRSDSDIIDA